MDYLTISSVAKQTGLSPDTLRWYEREGVLPPTQRTSSGQRIYDEKTIKLVTLVARLRRTGMPVAQTRKFLNLFAEGAASHGQRMALLEEHKQRVQNQIDQLQNQIDQLQDDLGAIQAKIDHYAELIEQGLDCNNQLIIDETILEQQRKLS